MIATTIITPTQMYWITRLDVIREALKFLAILVALLGATTILYAAKIDPWDSTKVKKEARKYARLGFRLGAGSIIFGVILMFIPSTKEMCAIYAITAIANNENAQRLGEDFYDIAKEWMQEFRPQKETEGTNLAHECASIEQEKGK